MICEFVERRMEPRFGERPFTREMSRAFFDTGNHPWLLGKERINRIGYMKEKDTGCYRVLVDLTRFDVVDNPTDISVPTARFEDAREAARLVGMMSRADALNRANRTLDVVADLKQRAGVVAAGGVAMAAVVAASS